MFDIAGAFQEIGFDDAVLFLAGRATAEAETIRTAGPSDAAPHLRRLDALAQAMAELPARSRCAIDAKRTLAGWSLDCGVYRLELAADLVDALIYSADRDSGIHIIS